MTNTPSCSNATMRFTNRTTSSSAGSHTLVTAKSTLKTTFGDHFVNQRLLTPFGAPWLKKESYGISMISIYPKTGLTSHSCLKAGLRVGIWQQWPRLTTRNRIYSCKMTLTPRVIYSGFISVSRIQGKVLR